MAGSGPPYQVSCHQWLVKVVVIVALLKGLLLLFRNGVHVIVKFALLKGLKYLRLRYSRGYLEIIRLRIVEESVHFFQNLLVILSYFFQVHEILDQGPYPTPSILVRLWFATVDILYQFEYAVAELLFFV